MSPIFTSGRNNLISTSCGNQFWARKQNQKKNVKLKRYLITRLAGFLSPLVLWGLFRITLPTSLWWRRLGTSLDSIHTYGWTIYVSLSSPVVERLPSTSGAAKGPVFDSLLRQHFCAQLPLLLPLDRAIRMPTKTVRVSPSRDGRSGDRDARMIIGC